MLFLYFENLLHDPATGGVVVVEPSNDLRIRFDCDPLCEKVLFEHIRQSGGFTEFRLTTCSEYLGIQFRGAVQLNDSNCDRICMLQFFVSVFQELGFDCFRVQACRGVVVARYRSVQTISVASTSLSTLTTASRLALYPSVTAAC